MISTGSIYTLHEHLCLTILNRGRRLLPDDQQNTTLHVKYKRQIIPVLIRLILILTERNPSTNYITQTQNYPHFSLAIMY